MAPLLRVDATAVSVRTYCIEYCTRISLIVLFILLLFFFSFYSAMGRLEQEETHNATTLSDVYFHAGLFPGRNRARYC
jgi:hypothetical protein